MVAKDSSAKGIEWNFEGICPSLDGAQIKEQMAAAVKRAEAFEAKYRPVLNSSVTPGQMYDIVRELEAITRDVRKPYYYAHLRFSQNTTSKDAAALKQALMELYVKAESQLIFVELAWCAIEDDVANSLMASPELADYRHLLEAKRLMKPHQLSEAEEKLMSALELSGRQAFVRLFDETMGKIQVKVTVDGQEQTLPMDGALAMLFHPDRDKRKMAHKGVTEALAANMDLLTFIFNTLVQHHATEDEFRKFPHPARKRNLANEVDDETVESLKAAVDRNVGMVARYYRLKAKLLGMDNLKDYDRYCPITQEEEPCDYEAAKAMTLAAYSSFSPKAGEIAKQFFDHGWIDADPRQGKEGGAFSASTASDHHPYIMLNFTDTLSDASTMAHEMGHGIHQYLARERGDLLMDTSLCMAETASIFGEMVLFTDLLAKEQDPKKRLNLLCGKIEGTFATVMRQIMMNRFETKLHAARRGQGELKSEEIHQMWLDENRWMFGDSVEMTEEYGSWWSYVLHFVHYPFYTYAYSFGELMVLSLYEQYRKQGQPFVPKYMDMLAAGGSDYPKNLMAKMGLDITKPEFWQNGLDLLDGMVTQAEEEAKKLGY
ncbi:MAG: M3 family oligoendopeptidase [Candidatus Thermoplasmatota archaeon]|nr:M3 family oligoendopeptidase [Euryarchaeota archaeon]MBU4032902.1 M3 family oligoendopeptidase [Candidatus Thermoplasmatota archaeon]MBU4072070.1 M3 family oligoendopeptidase [Candidatus Thermoplasmatota archaeon]MBU4144589.1 M3 family oligoendopeptidase [Candidatus Thermoplasmatota archaeon]MBU4592138.1 M3 family oligoendopeptidase [Candidatus Thermoplasmatota archaeon]